MMMCCRGKLLRGALGHGGRRFRDLLCESISAVSGDRVISCDGAWTGPLSSSLPRLA
jgi:hypothetical protein